MKKKLIMIILLLFLCNMSVKAASASLSVSSNAVNVGDTFTVYANMNNAAAWNIHVSASGPVSGCMINQADASSDAFDISKTFSATCTATAEGNITLTLSGDVTSASDGIPVGISGNTTVSVSSKIAKPITNIQNNKSSDNQLKEISIEGFELVKVDDNNYELSVSPNVDKIIINASAASDLAKVEGIGEKLLEVGDNVYEIIITAENGNQNKINVKVTRRDSYFLEDIKEAIKSDSDEINININSDSTLTKEDIDIIKESNKKIIFNYYDIDKTLKYSYIIDGKKIKADSFNFNISNESNNLENILKLSNYADGIYIKFDHAMDGISFKYYVGNKYEKDDLVNIYSFKNNKLNLLKRNSSIVDGYIAFNIDTSDEYFITMSNIGGNSPKTKQNYFFPLFSLIELLIILIFIMIYAIRKIRKKKML